LLGVPDSCRCDPGVLAGCVQVGSVLLHNTGCYTKVEPFFREMVAAIGGVAIGVAFIEVGIHDLTLLNIFDKIFSFSVGCWSLLCMPRWKIQQQKTGI
jgi:hypothetical protein